MRDIEFLHPLQVSILSEVCHTFELHEKVYSIFTVIFKRRSRAPYGLEGGSPGEMGRNLWVKQLRKEDGDLLDENDEGAGDPDSNTPRTINIGGKATVFMGKGDRLVINTPGGGGWGSAVGDDDAADSDSSVGTNLHHAAAQVVDTVKGAVEWAARGSLAERAAQQAGFGGF